VRLTKVTILMSVCTRC